VSAQPQPPSDRVLDPVEGWRTWALDRAGDDLRLVSPLVDAVWPHGRAFAATCRRHAGHRSPADECSCGIYAVSSPADLGSVCAGVSVVGSVALWGRVVEHQRGYRGELAYPQRLRLVCAACLEADGLFTSPESVVEHDGRVRALCGFHVWSAERSGRLDDRKPASGVEARLLGRYHVDLMPIELVPRTRASRRPPRRRAVRLHRELAAFAFRATLWILLIAAVSGGVRQGLVPVDPVVSPPTTRVGPTPHVALAAELPDPAFGKHAFRRNAARRAETQHLVLPRVRFLCGRTVGGRIAVADCDVASR
jgi:hypothetical protein